jgi:hypothetical protein
MGTGVLTAGWRATTAVSVASTEPTALGANTFVPMTTKNNAQEKRSRSSARI